jgi:hypothetical protein
VFVEITDAGEDGYEHIRTVEICGKGKCLGFPIIARSEVNNLARAPGYAIADEVKIPSMGTFVFIVRYGKDRAYMTEGPYRVVSDESTSLIEKK